MNATGRPHRAPPILGLVIWAALLGLASLALAIPPPQEVTRTLGTDSTGAAWQVHASRERPIVLSGPRRLEVQPKEPLDYLEFHTFLDRSNEGWIVDGRGRGVRVNLTDGTSRSFRVPVSQQLIGGIAAADGKLYFGENGAAGNRSVRSMEMASGAVRQVASLDQGWTPLALHLGKQRLWIAAWTGFVGRHELELIGWDWRQGTIAVRSRTALPWAEPRMNGLELVEADDGAAWFADGYAACVGRLDAGGAWQNWNLGGRTPSNLVWGRDGTACLLRRHEPPRDDLPPGLQSPAELKATQIALFQPGRNEPLVLPATTTTLRPSRDGGVLVGSQGRLAIEGGELRIVPADAGRSPPR